MNEASVLIPPAKAAEILNVCVGTLAIWRCKKRYPLAFIRIGSKIMYRVSDIEKFIQARSETGTTSTRMTTPKRGPAA